MKRVVCRPSCATHLLSTSKSFSRMRRFTDEKIMETTRKPTETPTPTERLAYSVHEAADLLGVNYFSVYRLIQRGKLKVCRALRGKLLVPRSELLKLLKTE